MNLERMKQAAIASATDGDRFAAVCTDGDYAYARTRQEAWSVLAELMDQRDTLNPENEYDYGLVRVDVSADHPTEGTDA